MTITANIIFEFAKRRVLSRPSDDQFAERKKCQAKYNEWRKTELEKTFKEHFGIECIKDKDVLDFGCGGGEMSFTADQLGAKSVTGIEITKEEIENAKSKLEKFNQKGNIKFLLSEKTDTIPIDDNSIDVILCFDVMEHVMEYEKIIKEWRRILRPNGKILIDWEPYYHPYGHHIYNYLPVPWVHVFLSDAAQRELCARIVDLPDFASPIWDQDENGNKINRFRGPATEPGFLNRLTMRHFERICRQYGLEIERKELVSFQQSSLAESISSFFQLIPLIKEFFTAKAIYQLVKP